jgi:hypothetical protein
MKRIDMRTFTVAVLAAFLALAAVSCAKVTGGSSSGADDNGGVTSSGPAASATSRAPSSVSTVGTQQAVMPAGSNPDRVTTPVQDESPVTLPSPAVLRAVTEAQSKLDTIVAGLEGTKVRFVDCTESSSCSARLEAPSLAGLRDLLQAVSAKQGGIGFVAREQLDAYTGRTFVADVTLGGTDTRPVPADENELLVN